MADCSADGLLLAAAVRSHATLHVSFPRFFGHRSFAVSRENATPAP